MEIKPMYDNTIRINVNKVKLDSFETKTEDKKLEMIPNGIVKVIKGEKMRQLATIVISGSMFLTAMILTILYSTTMNVSGIAYSIPTFLFLIGSGKLFVTLIEHSSMKKSVNRYKEDLSIGLTSTPPFISALYKSLHVKQIGHNGLTIFTLFYGGIATILLGGLKDASGGIFDFKSGIASMFDNPTTMAGLFTFLLLTVSITHIVFAIQRKKRILDIHSYFGESLIAESDLQAIRSEKNKTYRRVFITVLMIVVIIPIVVRFALKVFRRK